MTRTLTNATFLLLGLTTALWTAQAQHKSEPKVEQKEKAVPEGHSNHGEEFNEGPRQEAVLMSGTGNVHFPVTTKSPLAQKFFDQGVGQLHGFWYYEAERSFRKVATLDPKCAMAYWGMAMANKKNAKRRKGFLQKALKHKHLASEREQMHIDALNDYLEGKGTRKQKGREFVVELEAIVEKYPDDLESWAFYCYAMYANRSYCGKSYEEINKIMEKVIAKAPLHPVHHYRIHLWDYKDPKRALPSCAKCGLGSPAIAHMWHMPGHIYSRLKRYRDAIWQQEASARVDHAHMMRYRVMPDQIFNFAHNNEWLIRNLVYTGKVDDALALAKNMIELPRHPKYNTLSKRGSANYGRRRLFEVLYRFEMWDELIKLANGPHLEPTDDEAEQAKREHHLGVAYARLGDKENAERMIAVLQKRIDDKKAEAAKAKDKKKKPRSRLTIAQIENAIEATQGYLAASEKDYKTAVTLLKKAGEDKLQVARIQALAGDVETAIKETAKYVKARDNQVLPLAIQTEILWIAGKKKEAKESFDQLRDLSTTIQLGSRVFARLAPIAKELGFPKDWRVQKPRAKDFGKRPPLDSLGPFRWHPSPAPQWSLKNEEGKTISLKDYSGRPVIVIFYLGFGCLHCAEQLQAFGPMTEEFKKEGLSLIAISTDDVDGLKQSIANYKDGNFPFPLVANAKLDVFKAYRAYDDFENLALHGTFLIDGAGRVRWQDISYEPFMEPKFVLKEAKRLLGQDLVDLSAKP